MTFSALIKKDFERRDTMMNKNSKKNKESVFLSTQKRNKEKRIKAVNALTLNSLSSWKIKWRIWFLLGRASLL